MGTLDELYQQVILDHARERHGHGLRAPAPGLVSAESHQLNPLCGDEVTLRVAVGPGDVVADVSWTGQGCSISQAATSMLHDVAVGEPAERALAALAEFRAMIRARGRSPGDEAVLGDAVALAGVGRHANRVKCAMLGWTAFEDALHRAVPHAVPRAVAPEE